MWLKNQTPDFVRYSPTHRFTPNEFWRVSLNTSIGWSFLGGCLQSLSSRDVGITSMGSATLGCDLPMLKECNKSVDESPIKTHTTIRVGIVATHFKIFIGIVSMITEFSQSYTVCIVEIIVCSPSTNLHAGNVRRWSVFLPKPIGSLVFVSSSCAYTSQLCYHGHWFVLCPYNSIIGHARIAYRKQLPPRWTVGRQRSSQAYATESLT